MPDLAGNGDMALDSGSCLDVLAYQKFMKDECDNLLGVKGKDSVPLQAHSHDGRRADAHDRIASQVFRRLRLRHIQLMTTEREALGYAVNKALLDSQLSGIAAESSTQAALVVAGSEALRSDEKPRAETWNTPETDDLPKPEGPLQPFDPVLRAHHLAVTDLFVEKAIAYLEDHASPYQKNGKLFTWLAIGVAIFGAGLSLWLLLMPMIPESFERRAVTTMPVTTMPITTSTSTSGWDFALSFSRSFTAVGMIVLVAALLWRHAKANLDQAERLMERRHALRQGRLFVHLNDGKLAIDEMDKAFNWNYTQSNAFANIKDDAQAPWGAVTKELANSAAEILRAAIQAAVKNTESLQKDGNKK